MFRIFEVTNPFNPTDGVEMVEREAGLTIDEIGGKYKEGAWLCLAFMDGTRYAPLRDEWKECVLKDGDCVWFIPHVGTGVFEIISIIISVASIAVSLLISPPEVSGQPEADPVFDLTGQRNQNKLNKVIEDGYGTVKLYPSKGAREYSQFIGNDQWIYILLCLGHGTWDVEELAIGDTLFENFSDLEHEIALPGELITLFPSAVETSDEVAGTGFEMLGDTDPSHDWIGPYTANEAGTETIKIEVDIVFPNGLYGIGSGDGKLNLAEGTCLFEYREIGSVDWLELATFGVIDAVLTPQRFTLSKDVAAGRYEVRGKKTIETITGNEHNDMFWNGMRAFFESDEDFGDVTMLAVKARASSTLNNQSSDKINALATRMIPVPDGAGVLPAFDDYASRTATRSPIWAMVNILRAPYGGNFEDLYLDLDYFIDEAAVAEAAGVYFDWVYDQSSTVWENVKLPCFVNKATPILKGSIISFVRDQPATIPSFFINPENTLEGSFKLDVKLSNLGENDGAEVEYTDSTTWKPETVPCLLTGDAGTNPKKIKIQGITDRQKAFDLGMYLWSKERGEREVVTLTTGMEGLIYTYGDLGRIGSDIPRWGSNGYVTAIDDYTVTLSDPVDFEDGKIHQLAIRGKLGQDLGPYPVTAGSNSREVITSSLIPQDEVYFDHINEPPIYIFGTSDRVGYLCRIANLAPKGLEAVDVTAIVDDQSRFADFGTAPAIGAPPTLPTTPDAPVVAGLEVVPIGGASDLALAKWFPAVGATYYIVESSTDGVTWTPRGETINSSLTISIVAGSTLYVRVAGVNLSVGPWDNWTGVVGVPTVVPNSPLNLTITPAFVGTSARVTWGASYGAVSYVAKIYTDSTLRITEEVTDLEYEVTNEALSLVSGVDREITFDISAKNSVGESAPSTVIATNPIPSLLTGLDSFVFANTATTRTHRMSWNASTESDQSRYVVWLSETSGFTPGPSNLVYEAVNNTFDYVQTDAGSGFPPLYWRASAVDIWGDDTNPSAEEDVIDYFGIGGGDSFGSGGGDEFIA